MLYFIGHFTQRVSGDNYYAPRDRLGFTLKGYQSQSVPLRIAVNESSSMQSSDAGAAPNTVITPDPVMAELAPATKTTSTRR